MRTVRAVVDTNVLHAGLYSAEGASFRLLRLIDAGRLIPVPSTALLYEYEEILRRHKRDLGLAEADVNDVLDGLCKHGEGRSIHFLWRPQLRDPKDDHILELAVAAGHPPIVTHNVKDFGPAHLLGVRVITPAQLLEEMKRAH
jgi:putative PIN family toxin of toxin-antitoxin system